MYLQVLLTLLYTILYYLMSHDLILTTLFFFFMIFDIFFITTRIITFRITDHNKKVKNDDTLKRKFSRNSEAEISLFISQTDN